MYRPSKENWLDGIDLDQFTQKVKAEIEKNGGELLVGPKFVQFSMGVEQALAVLEKDGEDLYLSILAEYTFKRVNASKLMNYSYDENEVIRNLKSWTSDEQIWWVLFNDLYGSAFYQDFDTNENSNMMRWFNFVGKNNEGRTIKDKTYWQATIKYMSWHNNYRYYTPESADINKTLEQKINKLAIEKGVYTDDNVSGM